MIDRFIDRWIERERGRERERERHTNTGVSITFIAGVLRSGSWRAADTPSWLSSTADTANLDIIMTIMSNVYK